MWMTPYGSDCRHEPKDNEDIVEAALHAIKSLKRVHDKQFEIAPVCRSVSEVRILETDNSSVPNLLTYFILLLDIWRCH
jgi:hypothetical protein